MKTYLVTGGAGFVGANFIRYLLHSDSDIKVINLDALTYAGNLENLNAVENDPRYRFVQVNICNSEVVRNVFASNQVDYVVNFAAESHVDRSIEDPGIFVTTNVYGTITLLNAAMEAWANGDGFREGVKFLQVSTDEVYGALGAEGLFTEQTPLDPHSPYSASKASADLMVRAYRDTYGLPVNITRCSNNYGPYQFPEKLIPLMICNAMNHKRLPVYGDGLQVRDWLYVEDHCKAIELVLLYATSGEIYNIGGHNERTNLSIVNTIIDTLNGIDSNITTSLIQYVADRKGHDRRYAIDASKIKKDLGWEPDVMFEDGIAQTIRWYTESPEWLRHVTSGEYQEYYQHRYGELQ